MSTITLIQKYIFYSKSSWRHNINTVPFGQTLNSLTCINLIIEFFRQRWYRVSANKEERIQSKLGTPTMEGVYYRVRALFDAKYF